MSLYYEDFPADDGAEPQLPPLLLGERDRLRREEPLPTGPPSSLLLVGALLSW